jgi:hypothetical protein
VHRFLSAVALLTALVSTSGRAQNSGLDQVAERARAAWIAHDPRALIAGSPRLLIQLPGADPSVALGPAQAVALLANYLATVKEVEILVRGAGVVEPGRGYVELQRRYRVTGTQDIRTQLLLLGYQLDPSGWTLVELRVVG